MAQKDIAFDLIKNGVNVGDKVDFYHNGTVAHGGLVEYKGVNTVNLLWECKHLVVGYKSLLAVEVNDSEGVQEPICWLIEYKGDDRPYGKFEISEPNEKATNPKWWTDAFPVYRRPSDLIELQELLKESFLTSNSYGNSTYAVEIEFDEIEKMQKLHRLLLAIMGGKWK